MNLTCKEACFPVTVLYNIMSLRTTNWTQTCRPTLTTRSLNQSPQARNCGPPGAHLSAPVGASSEAHLLQRFSWKTHIFNIDNSPQSLLSKYGH